MPDVSMVQQQTLNRVAHGSTTLHDSEVATLFGTRTSLSRSQSQVVHFLNSSTGPCCSRSPQPAPVKTPVMHPNLVCTLRSILSPKVEFDGSAESSSFISPGTSPFHHMAQQSFHDRINALTALHSSSTTTTFPENSPWSNLQVSESKAKVVQQQQQQQEEEEEQEKEAVLVPVDLIQNRRPYQCAFAGCQRTFKNPQTMRMHHKTHFGDAAAAALAPPTTLSLSLSSLKAGHNKKIPSRCPMCFKTFVGLYELRRHFGRKHSDGEKCHACRKCDKRFHIEVDLRDHEKLCGEPIFCSCGMKFAFKCNLVAHKRTHPKCQDNGVVVTTSDHIEQSKRRKVSDSRSPQTPRGAAAAAATSSSSSQLTSPVQQQQPSGNILDSASASSTTTSSPSSSFVAEALPDFDVTSTSSCLDYHYHNSSLSADAYNIKFPWDHYFLSSYQALPQRGAQ